jgi:hypothetical protein
VVGVRVKEEPGTSELIDPLESGTAPRMGDTEDGLTRCGSRYLCGHEGPLAPLPLAVDFRFTAFCETLKDASRPSYVKYRSGISSDSIFVETPRECGE